MAFVKRLFDYQWGKMLHNTHRNHEAETGHKLLDSKSCGVSGSIVKVLVRQGDVQITELVVGDHILHQKKDRRVVASGATTVTLPSTYSAEDDYYNDCWITITKGHGKGQIRQITDYVGATKVATVAAWSYPPGTGAWFKLIEGKSALDAYALRGITLTAGDAVICRNVPFGYIGIDATMGSVWIFYKETKIPDSFTATPWKCNTSTSTTTTSTTTSQIR